MKKETKKPQQTIRIDAKTPPIMVDHFDFFAREDHVCFVRMSTILPEGITEQGKFFMTKESLRNFIDGATQVLDSFADTDAQKNSIN